MATYASAAVNNYVDALNVATLAAVDPDRVFDQIFDTSPLYSIFKSSNHLIEERGGMFIQRQINIGKSPNASWYAGAGGWKLAKFEGLVAMGWDWKLAHDSVLVTGDEILRNSGSDFQVVDLVQSRVDVTSLTLPDLVAGDMYTNNPYGTRSDGTLGNPASIEGLCVLVDDGTFSNTVGSLSRTTYPSLKSKVNYNNALGASFINSLQTLNLAANRGQSSRVRLHLTTETIFGSYWSMLQSPERYTLNPQRLEAMGIKSTGGNDLAFNDAPVLIDEKIPTGVFKPLQTSGATGGYWYGLNLDWFDFVVHPDRFFTLSEWQKDPFGDQYFMDVFFAGALLNNRPNKSFATWVSGG